VYQEKQELDEHIAISLDDWSSVTHSASLPSQRFQFVVRCTVVSIARFLLLLTVIENDVDEMPNLTPNVCSHEGQTRINIFKHVTNE
jgi:hypothetical protein